MPSPHDSRKRPRSSGAPRESHRDVERILERICEARNFDFRNYKRATLRRRIERRMADTRCRTFVDYLALLDRNPAEYDALISSMLIKVTSFFRDPEMWDTLAKKVLPELVAAKRPRDEIRIWSAGCATGEEAFSVAILLAEALGPRFSSHDVKVFGTDVDEDAIAFARRGIYSKAQVESVPPATLARWFVEEGGGYAVRKEIRRAVVFGVNNLVSDAPISRLDVLLCRNVFIYLEAGLQKRVLTRFHYALRRGGMLILGRSELIPFAGSIFEVLDTARRIYVKDGKRDAQVAQERLVGLLEQTAVDRALVDERDDAEMLRRYNHDVLESLSLPIVATGLEGTIMLWNNGAARLWSRTATEALGKRLASLNLAGLSGEILVEKTAAVREERSERELGEGTIGGRGNMPPMQVAVEVTPLRDRMRDIIGILYTVQDVTAYRALAAVLQRANAARESANEELRSANEKLQSANEELETTNEELQSANEELQTTNEELQSTNEELETTNEELQSTIAELDATNRELDHRTDEMNRLGFYHRTIIRSLSAAIVVTDPNGRITMWNLAAERLLGLTENEAMGQILWTMHVPAIPRPILQRVRRALASKRAMRTEELDYRLPTGGHGHCSVAAMPLVDSGNYLGAVIMFDDHTRQVALAEEVAKLKGKKTKKE